ncbi:hypothetical protein NF681_08605 [Comamonadaceae bacterium OTU4NAUVB1]|nr:hypothetical protein NF681_08605 [Comamonadaceae bacterium OTU4NAUVB1]
MTHPDPTLRTGLSTREDGELPMLGDGFDASDDLEAAAPDELEDETGIDLTDASDLDADNVPADEESERVVNAPD